MIENSRLKKLISHIHQWSPVTSVVLTLVGFVLSQIVGVIVLVGYALVTGVKGDDITTLLKNSLWLSFAFSLVVYGFYVWFIRSFLKWCKSTLRDAGLKMPKSLVEIPAYVFGGLVVYFVLTTIASIVVKQVLPSVNLDQRQDLGFNTSASGWSLLPVFLMLVIVPPIAEEIVCRGFLYTGLRKKMKIIGAGIITSIIFAMAHLQWGSDAPLLWAAAIDTFVLSTVLIYVREKSDSLVPAIGIHMLKNLIAFFALFVLRLA